MAGYITYSEKEKEIVRKGVPAMEAVLMGGTVSEQRSLLLALDWFMDPYFHQDISHLYEDLLALLQNVVISSKDEDVAEDALGLLTSYASPPFEILAQNFSRIPQRLKPEALYAIHMGEDG